MASFVLLRSILCSIVSNTSSKIQTKIFLAELLKLLLKHHFIVLKWYLLHKNQNFGCEKLWPSNFFWLRTAEIVAIVTRYIHGSSQKVTVKTAEFQFVTRSREISLRQPRATSQRPCQLDSANNVNEFRRICEEEKSKKVLV